MSSRTIASSGGWHVKLIRGKRYLNTGTALYEVIADDDARRFDEESGLHVYPYRNVETNEIVQPGGESEKRSTRDVTLVIAKVIAGVPWSAPIEARRSVSERLAHKRAQFDLDNGADSGQVQSRLHRQLGGAFDFDATSHDGSSTRVDSLHAADDSDGENVDWASIRRAVDGGGSEPATSLSDDNDDDDSCHSDMGAPGESGGVWNVAADANEAGVRGGSESGAAGVFHPRDYAAAATGCATGFDGDDEETFALPGGTGTAAQRASVTSPSALTSSAFDPPSGSFSSSSYGVLRDGPPAGTPVLNIPRVDPRTGYMSACEQKDTIGGGTCNNNNNGANGSGANDMDREQSESAKMHRKMVEDMVDDFDRAAAASSTDDSDAECAAEGDGVPVASSEGDGVPAASLEEARNDDGSNGDDGDDDEWMYDENGDAYYVDEERGLFVYYDGREYEAEMADGARNSNVCDRSTNDVDEKGREILMPTNLELDEHGRVKRRLDNNLMGRTADAAEQAQLQREKSADEQRNVVQTTLRPRKTMTDVERQLASGETKTLGEELKGFGLPAEMMARLNQQGSLKTVVSEFPESFDDVAHLARPFKSTTEGGVASAKSGNEIANADRTTAIGDGTAATTDDATASNNRRTTASVQETRIRGQPASTEAREQPLSSLSISVSLGELLSLRKSVSAQMKSLASLSDQVDRVILAKMVATHN